MADGRGDRTKGNGALEGEKSHVEGGDSGVTEREEIFFLIRTKNKK